MLRSNEGAATGEEEEGREVGAENLKGLHLPWPTCHDGVEQQPELVSVGWRRGDGKMSPNGDGEGWGLWGEEIQYIELCVFVCPRQRKYERETADQI